MEREKTAKRKAEFMTERDSDRETEKARKELKKVKRNREIKENWTDKQ
jgi:hypothetical protein